MVDDAITTQALAGRIVAVARDAAFCFIYAANLDCLRALGAEVVFFSPLADSALPDCDAVWLPGGYPELHAAKLGANTAMQDSLKAHVARHKPVWAECGGMMVLFDAIVSVDGRSRGAMGLDARHGHPAKTVGSAGPAAVGHAGRGVARPHLPLLDLCHERARD